MTSADTSIKTGPMHNSSPHTEEEGTAQETTGYSLWILGNQWTTAEQEGAYLKACTLLPQNQWAATPEASAVEQWANSDERNYSINIRT